MYLYFNFLAIGYISTYSNINIKHQYHPNNMLVSTSPTNCFSNSVKNLF